MNFNDLIRKSEFNELKELLNILKLASEITLAVIIVTVGVICYPMFKVYEIWYVIAGGLLILGFAVLLFILVRLALLLLDNLLLTVNKISNSGKDKKAG